MLWYNFKKEKGKMLPYVATFPTPCILVGPLQLLWDITKQWWLLSPCFYMRKQRFWKALRVLQGGRRASTWSLSADWIHMGLFSPCSPHQACTQAGQRGVEETEVWWHQIFHSKVPRQLVGSHGAACTPLQGESKEGRLAVAPSPPTPFLSGR